MAEEPGIKGILPNKEDFRPHRRDVGAMNANDKLKWVGPHHGVHNYADDRPDVATLFRTDVPAPVSAQFKATPPTTKVLQREATKKPAYQTGIPRQGGDVMPPTKNADLPASFAGRQH